MPEYTTPTMPPEYISLPSLAKDITGQKFGRLTALGPVGQAEDKQILWLCQCDCGNQSIVKNGHLAPGRTKSCGCANKDRLRRMNTTHGLRYDRTYNIWQGMKARCHNPTDKSYSRYGGRGIFVYEEWRLSFEKFFAYVIDLPNYGNQDVSIDRIDNDRGYEPGNIRWASHREQQRNTRTIRIIEFDGRRQCITAWAEELGMAADTLGSRIKSGWSIERAFSTPVRTSSFPERSPS